MTAPRGYDLVYHKEGRDDDKTWFLCGQVEDDPEEHPKEFDQTLREHIIETALRGIVHEVRA